jgi:hypothetical protein
MKYFYHEKRIKMLEEEICYLHRDISYLIDLYEHIEPEVHTHYTLIQDNRPCTACDLNNTDNLDELT